MKIKRVESDQFAGVHDIDVEFADGLNLVIGENESGKSTLADLIFRILFKDTKIDGRSDAEFIDWYFPKKVSGPQGDVIDGTLVFETESGSYKLTREWEKRKGSSRLTTPEKIVIKNTSEIARILSEELGYREGVFDEIVFASQKRKQSVIESIMKALPKKKSDLSETRDNLTSTLTRAALETGGVSLEKLENRLQETLDLYRAHWDFEADTPEGGRKRDINNKWSKGVGTILAAYYEMEETRQAQIDAEDAEKEVERCQKQLKEHQNTKKTLEEQLREFWKNQGRLERKVSLDKKIADDKRDIDVMKTVLKKWPEEKANLANAKELQKQQEFIQIKSRYIGVKAAWDEYRKKEGVIIGLRKITRKDVQSIEDKIKQKNQEERKISGLNLTARIKQLGDLPIEVRNIATGEPALSKDGEYNITGAVEITIPDVMEMQLVPKGIDVDRVREKIDALSEEIRKGFEQYGVSNIDELWEKQNEYENASSAYEKAGDKLRFILNGESWETIKEAYEKIDVELLTEEELENHKIKICGTKSIDKYMGGVEKTLEDYKNTYCTEVILSGRISEKEENLSANEEKLKELGDIPVKYRQIKDPKKYEDDINKQRNAVVTDIQYWNEKCTEAIRGLGERTAEDYTEELIEKETAFSAKKAEYAHWKNIANVFFRMKEQLEGNPMEDIEDKFREYLSAISDGNIELQGIDEKMSANLSSGNNKLAYDILSNGTKDTISLAFRLAMLEHLYPEGGGIAVFDDAFTEMDPKRVGQSCRLIEKFAEKNQVIFITCDDKYFGLMKSDNIIKMNK